jgi:tetratricopeptide (TPR) repeat protein
MTPPWLPLRPALPGRDAEIAEVEARIATSAEVAVAGPPGIGKTALAGAIVARGEWEAVAVSFAGCEDAADVVRVLGDGFGTRPVGDEGALLDAMRARGRSLLVADDVPSPAVLDAIRRLVASASDLHTIILSEVALADGTTVLGPLDAETIRGIAPGADPAALDGNPLLARLVAALDAPLDEVLGRLRDRAGLLAAFPMGLPGAPEPAIPTVALAPDRSDRTVLRRGVAARLGAPDPAAAATHALARVAPLLRMADGAHLSDSPDYRDVLLARKLARDVTDPLTSARCVATSARLVSTAGQFGAARALLGDALDTVADPEARALLFWADGDVMLAAGEVADALARYEDAARAWRRARMPERSATMLRRAGDRLAARGLFVASERLYREARAHYRRAGSPEGVGATVRGAADLAVGSGEWVSAGTLHEQAAEALDGAAEMGLERANLRLGEASLAIARGEYARAERLLQSLGPAASRELLLRANVARRRADLLLRRGDHDGAREAARQAADVYASIGEPGAHAACARLLGDIDAAAGRLHDARAAYGGALRLQVRIQDLRGLMRTLEHAAIVEDALGNAAGARRRREQRAAVLAVVGEA